ncbi:MAG: electron transfer flavoprotein subunit alpha/FixB family protein [Candidatus Goldbacteria bacterium]|nr:electron transfer flavoprotein subunit alpha/FixB family protein [Candidatus Goldiibacteriota bacterium]
MNSAKEVFVFLDNDNTDENEINAKILTEGYRIAEKLKTNLSAIYMGVKVIDKHFLEKFGVSKLYKLENQIFSNYDYEIISEILAYIIQPLPLKILIFAHTESGKNIAINTAFNLNTVAITDCVDIRIKNEKLFFVRSIYGDQFEQELYYTKDKKEIITLRLDNLEIKETNSGIHLEIINLHPSNIQKKNLSAKTLSIIHPNFKTVDISFAERIIGIGAGCATKELFSMAEELSDLLEASIGTTRPVVDEGILPKNRMIGQTGKTISPDSYLALGISGSPHHVAGIQKSKNIISVNRDPRAPIFNISDIGFVCDLNKLLPKLIEHLKHFMGKKYEGV